MDSELATDGDAISGGSNRWLGHVDSYDARGVHGWAADAVGLDRSVRVELVDATGRRLAQGVADLFRQDLADLGLGHGRHGFFLPLPDRARADGPVQIRVKESRAVLHRGVVELDAEAMMFSSPFPDRYTTLMQSIASEVMQAAEDMLAAAP